MKLAAAVIIALGFVFQYMLVFGPHQDKPLRMFAFKSLASICFASSGILACIAGHGDLVSRLIAAGLICGMFGDVFLHLRFAVFKKACLLLGILAFLAGHISYIAAMFFGGSKWYVGLIFAAFLLPVTRKYIFLHDADFGKILPLGTLYMTVELFFAGLTMSRMINSFTASTLLFFIGGISFVFSDVMWILQNFAVKKKPAYRIFCLIPYYLAQNLFAVSLLIV